MTTNGAPAATIDQVAAAAGVSRSTVSRVVNGSTSVSPAALAAVQQAIADLHFVPNRAARSLARRRTLAIGLVVPEDTTRFFGDPFFATIVAGINDRLVASDYVLNLFIAQGDAGTGSQAGDKLIHYIRGGNVDGAIISSHHEADTFVDYIAASIPVVFGGRPLLPRPDHFYVDVDNVRGGRDATNYLLSRGHRRIDTICGQLTMPAGLDRRDGYRQAMREAGLPEGRIIDGGFSADGGAQAMREILADGEPPDAIFVASDLMAIGALRALTMAGLSVPQDVAIIGFDDSPAARSVSPTLTTIRQPSFDQGAMMASVLLAILNDENPPAATILPTELVIRESA